MFKTDGNLEDLITRALAREAARLDGHPSHEKLREYRSGRLGEGEEDEVRAHVGLCHECAEWLLFAASQEKGTLFRRRRVEQGVLRWPGRLARKLDDFLASTVTVRRALPALALAVLALAAPSWLLVYRAWTEIDTLAAPKAGAVVVDVKPGTRSLRNLPGGEGTLVVLGQDDDFFTLIFPPQPGDSDVLTLRLLDSERNELWRTGDLEVLRYRNAIVQLSRQFLGSPGRYYAEVSDPHGSRPAEVYPITVRFEDE